VSVGPGSSPESEASSRERANLLRTAIGELAPRAAEMFTLRYLEELGNREIAALMGTSQAVVAVTLHNARSRLKKRLMELERGKQ
jgi:RNA polymerase sigma-70 factor (ECF subfamily)